MLTQPAKMRQILSLLLLETAVTLQKLTENKTQIQTNRTQNAKDRTTRKIWNEKPNKWTETTIAIWVRIQQQTPAWAYAKES